jgi:methylenetetrahydrofolate reductase (NADPH)
VKRNKKGFEMTKRVPISFEFFPPKTDAGAEKLKIVHQELQLLNPEFFSITYGAGGSTRERTLAAINDFNGKGTVAPHLSCIGDDKARIAELLDLYQSQGINRIVALRGDLPSGQVGLVNSLCTRPSTFIREHSGDHFHIEVAAYPEMHPQAETFDADIKRFVEKVNAGANAGITQFFFNPDAYFYFIERLEKEGIIPIAPGLCLLPMPATSFVLLTVQVLKFLAGFANNLQPMVMTVQALKLLVMKLLLNFANV